MISPNAKTLRACAAALALSLGLAAQATAADVTLAPVKKLTGKTLALPRVASPTTPATTAINGALAKVDATWVAFAKDCATQQNGSGNPPESNRVSEVTMLGPRYLSVVARFDYDCAAYPDTGTLALVYDLQTGKPVTWTRLLPGLVQKTSIDEAGDGSKIGQIESKRLGAFYRAHFKPEDGLTREELKVCGETLSGDPDPVQFILWPDAKRDGIVLFPTTLAHAVKACGPEVLVPAAELRKLGASAAFLTALDAAHKAHGWK